METHAELEEKLDSVKREYGSNHGRRILKQLLPPDVRLLQ